MKVTQVVELVNNVTKEILGKENLLSENLENVVDVGKEIFDETDVDSYVKSLVNHIGKVIFVNRPYSGGVASVLMDSWEYGSVLEKVTAEMPQATENESWKLEDGKDYSPNVFYQPTVSAKFFNKKVTFEVDMSFTELQVKQSFSNAEQLNGFLSMLYNAVDKSMTVKIDALTMRTINSMTAETIFNEFPTEGYGDGSGIKAVNLLKLYNDKFPSNKLTVATCIHDMDFLKFATMTMSLYVKRISKISSLFNIGGKDRFTPTDLLHIVMLADFEAGANVYLQAEVIHEALTRFPEAEIVPYWQGSGKSYDFDSVSSINVTTPNGNKVEASGILAVMFDRDALGVCNTDRRVTTNYNAKAEFFNNFYKFDAGYFNDLNENFVVFFVADASTPTPTPTPSEQSLF